MHEKGRGFSPWSMHFSPRLPISLPHTAHVFWIAPTMRTTRHLPAAFALLTLAFASPAQTPQPEPQALLLHPSGPPLTY